MGVTSHSYRTVMARPGIFARGRIATPRLVVVHCTEGGTAMGAASWFQNPGAGGSAHVVVDDEVVVRCVDDGDTAYHAKGVNSFSLGLEIAGYARWSRDEWLERLPRIREAARIHAGWCRKYGIPFVWSTDRGYHSHAGLPGNDHWDPGKGFPWDVYRAHVRGFLEGEVKAQGRPNGGSLRVQFPDGRIYGGWTDAEATYDGAAGGALRWIARQQPGRIRPGTIIRWRGGTFDTPADLPAVARTILNRTGGAA